MLELFGIAKNLSRAVSDVCYWHEDENTVTREPTSVIRARDSGVGEVVGAAQDHFSAQDFLGLRLVWEGILINWRLVWSVVCESGLRV